ncbi:PEP-CTERM protein-sorting domain-containing protein [Nostoc sp. DSM 114161]|jgi:hypothetical protein|uniref:PEP-CTERM sorting domain-containing protein n=1 Tax=Nostoc sp. DSM 114161 TaxID=3440143 RepID=UPI004046715C
MIRFQALNKLSNAGVKVKNIATALLLSSGAVLVVSPAQAAIINYNFRVESPTFTGQGSFSYDDTTFNNDPIPTAKVQSLSFSFDGESIVYNNTDDVNFPDFPVVFPTTFITGTDTIGLDFLFNDKNPLSDLSYQVSGEDFLVFSRTDPNTDPIFGSVFYTKVAVVPEPMTMLGTVAVAGLGLGMRRKQKLRQKATTN